MTSTCFPDDTSAKNICGAGIMENYFRKRFSLTQRPQRAVARIFSDTGYELFVNGRLAATLREWANVRDYDLTPFFQSGENIVAIHAMNHSGHRGLAFELVVNNMLMIVSDGSWKTMNEERWGWMIADFDDSSWNDAQVMDMSAAGFPQWHGHAGDKPSNIIPVLEGSPFFIGAIPKCIDSPFFTKKLSNIETFPDEFVEIVGSDYVKNLKQPLPDILHAKKVLNLEGNGCKYETRGGYVYIDSTNRWTGPSFVVDLGEEACGYFRMKIESEKPVTFRTFQAESLSEVLSEPERGALQHAMLYHEYRLEKGTQEFESRDRMGGRYVRIEFFDCLKPVKVGDFSLRWSLYPVRSLGWFKSDDSVLNDAWDAAWQTLHLCMQEFYLDAIKRDRMLWVADARAEALANYSLFGDTELFRFCWQKMAEVQYSSGLMPSSYGEGLSALWDFDAWYVIAFGDYIDWTGDMKFPIEQISAIRGAIDWLLSRTDADGLIAIPENPIKPRWMVVLNEETGRDPFLNSLFVKALAIGAQICQTAGDTKNANRYSAHAGHIEPIVRQLLLAHPLEKVRRNLESPTMFHYYINHRAENGDVEGALALLRTECQNMLKMASGTLGEGMPLEQEILPVTNRNAQYGTESLCHGWNALVAVFIARHIAGIQSVEPGWRKIRINPHSCGLKQFVCVVPTPHGTIAVRYTAEVVKIWLPQGVDGEFVLGTTVRNLVSGLNCIEI